MIEVGAALSVSGVLVLTYLLCFSLLDLLLQAVHSPDKCPVEILVINLNL